MISLKIPTFINPDNIFNKTLFMGKQDAGVINKQIEEFIKVQDQQGLSYSKSDLHFIQQYEGLGGKASKGASGEGVLYEFYTPDFVVELMWELAKYHGYSSGSVLEPSVGTGKMLKPLETFKGCVGFEPNKTAARIAELCCPGAKIYNTYFESSFLEAPRFTSTLKSKLTWIAEYPFSLVIGNPPYGIYKNQYSSFFPEAKKLKQMEIFFMYKSLQLLKPKGLLVFITGSNFLRNGDTLNEAKEELAKICDLVDAYRLPPVFQNSKVPTDIIVLKKKLLV